MSAIYDFFRDFAGPIGTVIAAGAAAFVAYRLGKSQAESARLQAQVATRNWQTANERVVLDLFERRLAIYEGVRHVVARVMTTGQPDDKDYNDYVEAIERVPFFFGPEVVEYFDHIRLAISNLQPTNMNQRVILTIFEVSQKRIVVMDDIADFYKKAPLLVGPYIQAHQKVGPWPTAQ
jgi:hypothetical protein